MARRISNTAISFCWWAKCRGLLQTPPLLAICRLLGLLLLCIGIVQAAETVANEPQPSVLVIVADDQGWGDLSCHGNENLQTPNLDSLRGQGASFDRFYVQPVCSPTRAELLTSCYAPRVGVTDVTGGGERLVPGVPTLADAFRAAGYTTAAFGKWHNGTQAPYHPLCRGFDSFYGYTSGHWADYFSPMLDRDGEITRGKGFLADDITNETVNFFDSNRDSPFFALVAFNTPHSPMQVPDRWWNSHAEQALTKFGTDAKREQQLHTRAALAMCENIDWNVGRLLDSLDRLEISERTIVVYLTDNGPNGHRFNAGMRGIKGSTDEGGVRSPLFVRWPGVIKPNTVIQSPSAVIDLAPTLAELASIALQDGPQIDGVSLAPALHGQTQELADRTLFSYWAGKIAARRGSLVLDEKGRLYDLSTDPNQLRDLSEQRPAETNQLRQEVALWRREVCEKNRGAKPPFTVGYPPLSTTQLPVRDATSSGGIRRSNRHFNCTFFTNWTSTDETIDWDVQLETPGRFRATAYYTCSSADIGSLVELRMGQHSTQARVATSFDPPLEAAKADRFPRVEGDMKRFQALDLGELNLPAGRGKLTLSAVEITGANVMDFRLLELTKLD